MQSNQPLSGRPAGLFQRLESWLSPNSAAPAAGLPQPSTNSVSALLDQLNLSGQTGQSAPSQSQVQTAANKLAQPASLSATDWQALAQAYVATGGTDLASALQASGVRAQESSDGQYVVFSVGNLTVTAQPGIAAVRRTQGNSVQCYEGGQLVESMQKNGALITVASASGTEVWNQSTGQATDSNGNPIPPKAAPVVPGEAPRGPWLTPSGDALSEPSFQQAGSDAVYDQEYDQAIQQSGGQVIEGADMEDPSINQFNCHSFATTGANGDLFDPFMKEGSPHWLNNSLFQLQNGAYGKLSPSQQVHVGDLVVYRNAQGAVTHTAVVKAVDASGNPTQIESKFGKLGLYAGSPFDVPPAYGQPTDFYRPLDPASASS